MRKVVYRASADDRRSLLGFDRRLERCGLAVQYLGLLAKD
jgi:hypothetical protein